MSATCPIDMDVQRLRSEIATLYTRVASDPDGEFHFHRDPEYAAAYRADPRFQALLQRMDLA